MLIAALSLPQVALCHNKLSKKSVVEQSKNSANTNKLLSHVDSMHIKAHLTPDNSNIRSYTNEQYEYLEMLVIVCQLKDNAILPIQLQALHKLFHQLIPYPLAVEIKTQNGEKVQWSLAEKTINQADSDSDSLVLREMQQTDWLNATEQDTLSQALFNALAFNRQQQQHFLAYYQGLQSALVNYLLARNLNKERLLDIESGNENLAQQQITLRKVQQLKQEIAGLEAKRNKTQQFNEKVELNITIQKLKQQLIQIVERAE